jgi:hypothetical protein
MARHNRDGRGSDQRGFDYEISYQPDWLQQVKVTRNLESGRQSTKTLFRNALSAREQSPGSKVRTRIRSPEQGIEFEIAIHDPKRVVKRIIVETVPAGQKPEDGVSFSLEDAMPPAR